jgi:hypothetical protein
MIRSLKLFVVAILVATFALSASVTKNSSHANDNNAGDTLISNISGQPSALRRHLRLRNPADMGPADAERVYQTIKRSLQAGYAQSGRKFLRDYQSWQRFNTVPYLSKTHGNHYLNNYGNTLAAEYGKHENGKPMPVGAILVKDSFSVTTAGEILLGPLAVMIKMEKGFNVLSGDWMYIQVQPIGEVLGQTHGMDSDKVRYCIGCHRAKVEQDHLYFVPQHARFE